MIKILLGWTLCCSGTLRWPGSRVWSVTSVTERKGYNIFSLRHIITLSRALVSMITRCNNYVMWYYYFYPQRQQIYQFFCGHSPFQSSGYTSFSRSLEYNFAQSEAHFCFQKLKRSTLWLIGTEQASQKSGLFKTPKLPRKEIIPVLTNKNKKLPAANIHPKLAVRRILIFWWKKSQELCLEDSFQNTVIFPWYMDNYKVILEWAEKER